MIIKIWSSYILFVEKIVSNFFSIGKYFFSRARVYTYNNKAEFDPASQLTKNPLSIFTILFQSIVSHKILVLSLLIILLAFPIALNTFKNQKTAEAAWYDDNWGYRQTVAITNSGTSQSDFQVTITLDTAALITAGKMQSDCDDIRVTDISGKILPHWIETGAKACNTSTTYIWTKVPSISTTGTTIYLYYGNPSATNVQNGNNVFVFFDDFSDSSIDSSKWTQGTIGSTSGTNFSESSGTLIGGNTNRYIQSINTYTGDNIAETRIYTTTSPVNGYSSIGFYASSSNNFGILDHAGTSYYRDDSDWINFSYNGTGQWNRDKVKVAGTSATYWRTGETSGSATASTTNSGISSEYLRLGPRFDDGAYDQNYSATWDWIFVRKAVTTEPTVASPTNEEKSAGPIAYWKFDEGYGTGVNDSTGRNSAGTISGATWQTEDQCISGKCLSFNGSNNSVNTGYDLSWNNSNLASISFWLKPMNITDSLTGIMGKQNPNWEWAFYQSTSSVCMVYWNSSGGHTNGMDSCWNSVLETNKWIHLEYTWDGSTSRFYANGKLNNTKVATDPSINQNRTNSVMVGGNIYVWSDTYFKGLIDEVKFYKTTRSINQVNSDYLSKGSGTVKGTSVQMGTSVQNSDALSNGLVGYWKMDETSWTNDCSTDSANDSSGNAKHGDSCPASTGPLGGAVGKYGNSGNFDGTEEFLNMGNQSIYDFGDGQDFTISAWINRETYVNNHSIVAKRNGVGASAAGYNLWIDDTSDDFRFEVSDGTNEYLLRSSTVNTSSSWYHVVTVFDEDNASNTQIYINGVKDTNSVTGTLSSVASLSTTRCLTVGGFASNAGCTTAGYPFDGSIDEVRIYNRAMSPTEVSKLYNWAPGPVGYWNMDEGTGNPNDSSGNGNNGSWNGTGSHWTNGKFGKASNYNGSDDFITINHTSSLDVPNAWTTSAWVYLNATPVGYPSVFTDSYPGAESKVQFDLSFNNSTAVPTIGFYNASSWYRATSPTTIPLNTWTHLTGTYDGPSGILKIFVNGFLVATTPSVPTSIGSVTTAKRIGRRWDIADYINGKIDEVKLYNYARTSKQVIEDMNAGHPAGGSPIGSQIGYWKMDEGYGGTANNSIASGGNGTLRNNPTWTNQGKFGKALITNGSNQYVEVPDSVALEYTGGDLTLSSWVYRDPAETDGNRIISKPWNGSGQYNYFLATNGDGTIAFGLVGATSWSTSSTDIVPTNSWTHLVATVNGTSKTVNLYKNGVLSKTDIHNISSWTPTSGDSNLPLAIGTLYPYGDGGWSYPTHAFRGMIDETKIYTSELTTNEVKLDYYRGGGIVLGSISDTSGLTGGSVASNSASAEYCVPGDTASCNSPIGEWTLNEKTGTNAYDTSGNNNTGSITGAIWSTGKVGPALDFNGSTDFVSTNITSHPSSFTVEAWANTDVTDGTYDTIISKFTSSPSFNGFFIRHISGNIEAAVYNAGSGYTSTTPITTNGWNYWTMSFDGSTIRLYKNGIQVDTDAGTMGSNSTVLIIGGNYGGASEPFNGKIDQVKYFNYARTPAQISWDYNRGGPVGWWKMDECQGTTANDASGNSYTGTISIGATVPQTSVGTCTDGLSTSAWYNGRNGKYSSSLKFDGIDDSVSISSPLNPPNYVSVTAWFKRLGSPTGGYHIIFMQGTQIEISIPESTGQIRGGVTTATLGRQVFDSGSGLTDGNWHFLTITYDGANLKSFIDAKQVSSNPVTGALSTGSATTIGSYSGSYYTNGQIDEVKVFNYALTPTQIKQIYNSGSALQFAPITGTP